MIKFNFLGSRDTLRFPPHHFATVNKPNLSLVPVSALDIILGYTCRYSFLKNLSGWPLLGHLSEMLLYCILHCRMPFVSISCGNEKSEGACCKCNLPTRLLCLPQWTWYVLSHHPASTHTKMLLQFHTWHEIWILHHLYTLNTGSANIIELAPDKVVAEEGCRSQQGIQEKRHGEHWWHRLNSLDICTNTHYGGVCY